MDKHVYNLELRAGVPFQQTLPIAMLLHSFGLIH